VELAQDRVEWWSFVSPVLTFYSEVTPIFPLYLNVEP
jgi:hypothetical protein